MVQIDRQVVRSVVLDHLNSHGMDGSLTARVVREEVERRCSMEPGALVSQKEALMNAIEEVIGEQLQGDNTAKSQQAASPAECAATRVAVESDPASAKSLVDAITGATEPAQLLEQAEAACASKVAAERLIAAGLVPALVRWLAPGMPRPMSALALRALTAASLHRGVTVEMLKAGTMVPAIIAGLATAPESLTIPLVDLVHNLADEESNRLRLVVGGCLPALSRQLLEPTASATLKEHALNAVASLAGVPDTELSFPGILALCCASRFPGTQCEGVKAMTLLADKPELRGRLAAVEGLPEGLRAAAASRDASTAKAAAELLAVLNLK